LQLGVRVPYTFAKGAGLDVDPNSTAFGQQSRTGLKGSGLGDPLYEAKVRIIGQSTDLSVIGLSLFGTVPVAHSASGTKDTFIGDSSPTFGGRLIYDVLIGGRLGIAAIMGGEYRKEAFIGSAKLGPELRYGAGASFLVSPVLSFMAEGFGSASLSGGGGNRGLETALAAQLHPMSSKLLFTLGGGLGVIDGVGSPSMRFFAGAAF